MSMKDWHLFAIGYLGLTQVFLDRDAGVPQENPKLFFYEVAVVWRSHNVGNNTVEALVNALRKAEEVGLFGKGAREALMKTLEGWNQ